MLSGVYAGVFFCPHFRLEHLGVSFTTSCRQAVKKFGKVVTVRRWVRGAPRRADVSFATAEEADAAIEGLQGKDGRWQGRGRTGRVLGEGTDRKFGQLYNFSFLEV